MDDDRMRARNMREQRAAMQADDRDGATVADGDVVRGEPRRNAARRDDARDNVRRDDVRDMRDADGYVPNDGMPYDGAVTTPAAGIGETAQVIPERRILSWGAIWGGLLTGTAIFLLLELLLYAVGVLTTTSGGTVGPSSAATWVTGILSLFGFFVGGWVAEVSARTRGVGSGLLNGLMVWSLGVGLILAFSLLGLGSVFGALGNALGGVVASGGTVGGAPTVNGREVAAISRLIALGAFIWLVLSAICAMIGGWLGSAGGSSERLMLRLPGRLVRR